MADRTVTTQGRGTGQALPDKAAVTLAVEVSGQTPAAALRACGQVQAEVLVALGATATAGGVSVQPVWDHARERPGQPQAVSTVSALLELDTAGEVVMAALDAGGVSVQLRSLSAVVGDPVEAEEQARAQAFAAARTAAAHYAALAGAQLGTVLTVGTVGGGQVFHGVATMGARTSAKGFDIPEGARDVTVTVTATWELLA